MPSMRSLPLQMAWLVAGMTAIVIGMVVITPWCDSWNAAVASGDLAPSWQHALGTDRLGRSVLDKLLRATPPTIGIAVAGAAIAICFGTLIGAIAGMCRGWIDEAIVWMFTTVASIPGILLMIALSLALSSIPAIATVGHGWPAMALALGLCGWVGTARLIRSEVRQRRDSTSVEAARSLGLSRPRIWRVHILPFTSHIIIIEFATHVAGYIQAGVILSFLGTGPANVLSWGMLIDEGRTDLVRGAWWQMTVAAAAVLLTSIAAHVLADDLRDRLDPTIGSES